MLHCVVPLGLGLALELLFCAHLLTDNAYSLRLSLGMHVAIADYLVFATPFAKLPARRFLFARGSALAMTSD